MFGMNFGIELKMLGFMHIPEVCSHPQIFCTNFGIELKMLGFKIILEICFHPQMFGTNLGKELKILFFPKKQSLDWIWGHKGKYPPNVVHLYQDWMKNFGFSENRFPHISKIGLSNSSTHP